MNEREYVRLRKQIEDDYRHKVVALATVWALASPGVPVPVWPPERNGADPPEGAAPRGSAASAITRAVEGLGEQFTTTEVAGIVEATVPNVSGSSVSHALRRMVADGRLACVEPGKGKRPSRYRKVAVVGEPRPALKCTPTIRARIVEQAKRIGLSPDALKARYLAPHNLERIADMALEQAIETLQELQDTMPAETAAN